MEFHKYSSIENSYRTKTIEYIEVNCPGQEFVVVEKCHGSNFSISYDGKELICGKRTSFLNEDDKFFNFQRVRDRYEAKIKAMYYILSANSDFEVLTVCGELYGGTYPHPDVEKIDIAQVQKGVFYNNDVDLLIFDIKLDSKFMGTEQLNKTCEENTLPYLKTLFTGTLTQCLAYSNEFQTTIPEQLGLPPIENNICEGVVIRPTETRYIGNERVILKNKNEKFTESHGGKSRTPKPPKEISENVRKVIISSVEYVNENRLRNVLSKLGPVTTKDFGKILGSLSKDAVEDVLKDLPEFSELEKKDRKIVTSIMNKEAGNLIRPNFLNIIDGNY